MTKTETARTYFVAGDTCEWETFTTLGAARRRAELLWHRDVIAFPATIRLHDAETQETHDIESYHPGSFTFPA